MDASSPAPPPGLKVLAPILKHAAQLRTQVPVMSYLCSLYAVQLGLKIKGTDPANKAFLLGLMDRLESQRAELGPVLTQVPDQKTFATNFVLKVFGHADDEYRGGFANRETAKNFYSASVFFDVLRQFDDPLPDDMEKMRKYAKYSAIQITKAIKEGRPVVHPDMENEQVDDSVVATGSNYDDPFLPTAGFPNATQAPSWGSPSTTIQPPFNGNLSSVQPPSYQGVSAGGSPTFPPAQSRADFASPSSSLPAYSPPPSHTFPSAYDIQPIPPSFPITQSQPIPPGSYGAQPPSSADSIEQLLSLFPTVPVSSSSGVPPTSAVGASTSGSPNLGWPTTSAIPPSHPSPSASPTMPYGASMPNTLSWSNPAGTLPSAPAAGGVPHPSFSSPSPALPTPATTPTTTTSEPVTGFTPSAEAIEKAQKCARFAVSALQFEDLPYAIQNLQQALSLLTGKPGN